MFLEYLLIKKIQFFYFLVLELMMFSIYSSSAKYTGCYVDDTLLLPRTPRDGLDQNGRLEGQIASWEPNK